MLVGGMNRIEATENLMMIRAACTPTMKKQSREKLVNALDKIANPAKLEFHAITHDELARILNG